jgi:hypothetical protein
MRGKRSPLAAFVATGFVLAQLAGCGGCVKDDPEPSGATGSGRKPIDLRAVDQRLSQFGGDAQAIDASSD